MTHRVSRFKRPALTLIELLIVVVILGILAAITIPYLSSGTDSAEAAAELSNVRAVFDAVGVFKIKNGRLPSDGSMGAFPGDLNGYLPQRVFTNTTPSGGKYDWNGPPAWAANPGLFLVLPAGTSAASLGFYDEMESLADDGSPATGWIRASGNAIEFKY